MKYKLIVCTSPHDLETDMNELLADGWEPYGDPILNMRQDGETWYAQALIKLPEPTDADEE